MPTPSYPSASNDPNYRPSGGTALTAAGLAIPGGIVSLIVGISAISGVGAIDSGTPGVAVTSIYIALIGGLLSGIALLVGAGLIFGGKPAGRWLVVLGCAIVFVCLIIVSAMVGSKLSDLMSQDNANYNGGAATGAAIGVAFLYSIPAIATFVLAVVPVSGRYLAFRSGGGGPITPVQGFGYQAPQQQMYGQQPGFPQQQPGFQPQQDFSQPQQGFPPSTPGGFPQQGGFPQPGGNYPPSDSGGFPQQPPANPPQQW
jgi:uncharacterized membrane protein